MNEITQDSSVRQLLIDMLREAAKLEHCLLNAYLAAACSVKSTPQEFASIGTAKNLRRAVQFERVRAWKTAIMGVAHEEMQHLHLVQCMLRALGETPFFGLPDRTAAGVWNIPNWQIQTGEQVAGKPRVEVPVRPLDHATIQRFVLYESTDSLQDENPFGPASKELFARLYAFEFDLRLESMLAAMPPQPDKTALLTKLRQIYQEVTPSKRAVELRALAVKAGVPDISDVRFQSIADFYERGILPLYEQAFDAGWVVNNDRNLIDEQLNPDYAQEGALPIGPIVRSLKFARFAQAVQKDPLSDYKRVADIVKEIVEEGEGATLFRRHAERMLAKAGEIHAAGFLAALTADQRPPSPDYVTPDWLAEAQMLRSSHLYKFVMIMVEFEIEQTLARQSDTEFEAARTPVPITAPGMRALTEELPRQFNACYVAMLAWLSRMYEPRQWAADKARRMAIEMIATWPLMSLAIRPFLELASFFPINWHQLFRIDRDGLSVLPIWGQELLTLWESPKRSEAINEKMDYLVVRTLRGAADWARDQLWAVDGANISSHEKEVIRTRLTALTRLAEFERQYPYRVAGGYSDRAPSNTYQNTHKDNSRYEENPSFNGAIFAGSLVMRLRFNGWGLVQLATDPDPPTDEAGCTGTLMLHAADGDRRFDRALVWQDFNPRLSILRPVAQGGPPLGVNVLEASLMAPAPGGVASAGYLPLQVMSSTGAVQTHGLQQDLGITGLYPIISLGTEAIVGSGRRLRVFLETKDGMRPHLYGENHLVWQDGEPIDPFIIAIYVDSEQPGAPPVRLLQREVFNEGRSMAAMEPYQRLMSRRGPCGFDNFANVPPWAMTDALRNAFAPGFPQSYLLARQNSLIQQIQKQQPLSEPDQDEVDQIVSLAERLFLLARAQAQPSSATLGWLTALLHYGHTISGTMSLDSGTNPILSTLSARTGIKLDISPAAKDRRAPNSRWLAAYTKGVMDTDALSDFIYGELYIPVTAISKGPVSFSRTWNFTQDLAAPLAGFAANFNKPFWAPFSIQGDERTETVVGIDPNNPSRAITLTDRVTSQTSDQYAYTTDGFPGVNRLAGAFAVSVIGDQARLTWTSEAVAVDPTPLVTCLSWFAMVAGIMDGALRGHFGPQ